MDSRSHPTSPESTHDGEGQTRKRKRKTFSCDTCRKRKLKCDRELPICGRCRKSGNASTCVYENPPEPAAPPNGVSQHGTFGAGLVGQYGQPAINFASPSAQHLYPSPSHQAERIAALESRLARIDPSLAATPEQSSKRPRLDLNDDIEPALSRGEDALAVSFYGAGFKTGFFGPSSERTAAAYYPTVVKLFPDLKAFVSFNNLSHPLFAQVRAHIYAIRKNSKLAKKMLPQPPAASPFDAVPDKDHCIRVATLYWDTIANTYHIFHGPTFWTTFWTYWTDPSQRTEAFACTLLLMLACGNALEQQPPYKYRGLSHVGREQAAHWIDTCETWMNRQSRKHLSIESFQNRILLIIAKQINAIKRKQVWERASELFALAISTGLHQDATKIDNTYVRDQAQSGPSKPKTTPYEREMRRRLWAAIVEIEMQASIDKGVPSSRLALMADCGRPTMLTDEQFDVSTSALPPAELRSTCTAASYLHLSQESLRLRSSVVDLINTGMDHLSYDQILEYEDQIKKAIDGLPQWVHNASSSTDMMVPAALLKLQLVQLQLLLHTQRARSMERDSRANLSRMACIDSSMQMLDIHLNLSQMSGRTNNNHWLNLFREDAFRAIIGIAYNIVIWRGLNSNLSSTAIKDVYIDRAMQGLDYFRQKVLTLGDHYVQMWYTLAAVGMLRSSFALHELHTHVTTVADDLTGLFGRVCNAQEEISNEHTAAGALTALATPNSGGYDASSSMTPLPMPDFTTNAQNFIDNPDMSAWGGFDDLWPFNDTGLSW